MTSPELLKRNALRQIPNLKDLSVKFQDRRSEFFEAMAKAGAGPAAPAAEGVLESAAPLRAAAAPEGTRGRRHEVLEAGGRALTKLAAKGEAAELLPDERFGLEAIIVLQGRPALLIRNGRFADPPDGWSKLARPDVRPRIESTLPSVGRIEVSGHPAGLDWIGTGFLVAEDVVMTNRHVAVEFARTPDGRKWEFIPRMTSRIDYVEEYQAPERAEFKITAIVGVHADVDLALLRVSRRGSSGAKPRRPLPLAGSPTIKPDREVYVVGYPASDSRRNDPIEMRRIFEDIFDVKRLQPGRVLTGGTREFEHDCSTLGGNSGSCVVDLETHQVIGLHFQGRYLEANTAVVLSRLKTDPLIKKAKLAFA
jgi:S1-C subfamily serine protease